MHHLLEQLPIKLAWGKEGGGGGQGSVYNRTLDGCLGGGWRVGNNQRCGTVRFMSMLLFLIVTTMVSCITGSAVY